MEFVHVIVGYVLKLRRTGINEIPFTFHSICVPYALGTNEFGPALIDQSDGMNIEHRQTNFYINRWEKYHGILPG